MSHLQLWIESGRVESSHTIVGFAAHFVSDVVVAAVVAYAIVALLWRAWGLPLNDRGEDLRQAQDQRIG